MQRRTLLATLGTLATGSLAGCLGQTAGPKPRIDALELRNDRRDAGYEFTAAIEADGETVFETKEQLSASTAGNAAVVFENPVTGPGAYEVTVRAADEEAVTDTTDLISEGNNCLYIECYLSPGTLHVEHTGWPCERSTPA